MKKNWSGKKIALVSLAILMVVAMVSVGAWAYFTDVGKTSGRITAGTLDLRIDDQNGSTAKFDLVNWSPGDRETFTWELKNAGTVDGVISGASIAVTQSGGSHTDAEVAAGDTGNAGNLGQLVKAKLIYGGTTLYDGYIGALNSWSAPANVPLAANGASPVNFTVEVYWPWSTTGVNDNLGQGDTLTGELTVYLSQAPNP